MTWTQGLLFLLAVTLTGCSPGADSKEPKAGREKEPAAKGRAESPRPDPPSPKAVEVPPPEYPNSEIILEKATPEQLDEVIQKHPGKVVMVDCWATWCIPCRKLFPHTIELSEKHRGDGLIVITLSFDEPDEMADALKYLKENEARTQNYLAIDPAGADPFEAFEIDGGAIPHYRFYKDGKLVRKLFVEEANPVPITGEKIDEIVRELLQGA